MLVVIAFASVLAPDISIAQGAPGVRFLGFTPASFGGKLECRLAVAHALDRESILAALRVRFGGAIQPATSIDHPRLPPWYTSPSVLPYDPGKAKQYLGQCGLSGPLAIKTGAFTTDFSRTVGAMTEGSLEKILGVDVTFEQVSNFQSLVADVRAAQVPVFMMGWQADSKDFGYPSFALGIANELMSDPEIKDLVAKRDGKAVAETLITKGWVIPILFF